MMQKVKIIFFILFAIFTNIEAHAKSTKKPPYEDYLIQITQTFTKRMKDELNLDYGGKGFDIYEKVEKFEMHFHAKRRATIEEARTLQLLVMNKLVQAINDHKGVQPYLSEIPFTVKGVKISINFSGPFGEYYDGSVTYVSSAPNNINKNYFSYYATDPITESSILLLQEPYDEAVKLAQALPIKNPHLHQTSEVEILSDQIFLKFGKELSEKNSLYLSTVGANLTNGIEEISAKFIFFSPSTIDEARKIALLAIDKILSAVNKEPSLKPYLKPYPFPTAQLTIRIEFRKNDKSAWGYSSYTDGSMDSLEIKNNVFSYFRTPPKGSEGKNMGIIPLHPPLFATETYQEALEAIRKVPPPQKKKGWW